jgi:hypothetical protein
MLIRLRNGSEHEMVANQPGQYNISTFAVTDRPLAFSPQSEVSLGRMDTPLYAMGNRKLLELSRDPKGQGTEALPDRIESPLRLSGGVLVLMLIGVPLGDRVAARRQEQRIYLHHSAGAGLLPALEFRHRVGQTGPPAGLCRSLAGEYRLRRGWTFPV